MMAPVYAAVSSGEIYDAGRIHVQPVFFLILDPTVFHAQRRNDTNIFCIGSDFLNNVGFHVSERNSEARA
jgi:hypothetical protein